MAGGRPTLKSAEVLERIYAGLETGTPLTVICREDGMPSPRTVWDWEQQDAEVSKAIARAREIGEYAILEECRTIADTPMEGEEVELDEAGVITKTKRGDMLAHRKLQIETRLKLLAKFNPRRWGDKMELSGDPASPLTVVVRKLSDA